MSGLFAGTPLERPVTCHRCGKPFAGAKGTPICACPRGVDGKVLDPADQPVRVQRESGGRGGKMVTVARGFARRSAGTTDLAELLKTLKGKLGTGGTLGVDREGGPTLELQGDHRDRIVEVLRGLGYPAKPSGG